MATEGSDSVLGAVEEDVAREVEQWRELLTSQDEFVANLLANKLALQNRLEEVRKERKDLEASTVTQQEDREEVARLARLRELEDEVEKYRNVSRPHPLSFEWHTHLAGVPRPQQGDRRGPVEACVPRESEEGGCREEGRGEARVEAWAQDGQEGRSARHARPDQRLTQVRRSFRRQADPGWQRWRKEGVRNASQ
ncbi:hypothetical protein BJY59DRAFT_696325, partial [Rhodotorula toruloides]